VIALESAQAGVAGFDGLFFSGVAGAELGGNHHAVASALEGAADQLLGVALAVKRRGVEKIDTGVQAGVERVERILLVLRPPVRAAGNAPAAHADGRDLDIGLSQRAVFHQDSSSRVSDAISGV